MNTSPFKSLDELLAELPREIAPPQDLWPSIAESIRPTQRLHWPLALAASVVLVLVSLVLGWQLRRPVQVAAPVAVALPSAPPVTDVNFESSQRAAYVQARAQLEQTFRERLKLLRPNTRAKIEANLKVIHDANENILNALEADPASPLLLQLLQNTRQQEIDLYTNVARATEPALGGRSL